MRLDCWPAICSSPAMENTAVGCDDSVLKTTAVRLKRRRSSCRTGGNGKAGHRDESEEGTPVHGPDDASGPRRSLKERTRAANQLSSSTGPWEGALPPCMDEQRMDALADAYVSGIQPDMSTVVCSGPSSSGSHQFDSCDAGTRKRGRGSTRRTATGTRRTARPDDVCTMSEAAADCLARLFPPGTSFRRPAGKLVQQVAQVIHDSPQKQLRVHHVYEALMNRYPFYRLMDKKAVATWKSSVRHALYQRWFQKTAGAGNGTCRSRSYFWEVNYNERPREWSILLDSRDQFNKEEHLCESTAELPLPDGPTNAVPVLPEPPAHFKTPSALTGAAIPQKRKRKCEEPAVCSVPQTPCTAQSSLSMPALSKEQQQQLFSAIIQTPPHPTPQYWNADISTLALDGRLRSPQSRCSDFDEDSKLSKVGSYCEQEPAASPSSAHASAGTAMPTQTVPPWLLSGTPQPHVALSAWQQHNRVPLSSPVHDRAQYEWQPSPTRRWPGDSDSLTGQFDLELWHQGIYSAENSNSSRLYGNEEPLAPPPALCSARLTQDMETPLTGSSCDLQPPLLKPLWHTQEQTSKLDQQPSRQELPSQQTQLSSPRDQDTLHEQPVRQGPSPQQEASLCFPGFSSKTQQQRARQELLTQEPWWSLQDVATQLEQRSGQGLSPQQDTLGCGTKFSPSMEQQLCQLEVPTREPLWPPQERSTRLEQHPFRHKLSPQQGTLWCGQELTARLKLHHSQHEASQPQWQEQRHHQKQASPYHSSPYQCSPLQQVPSLSRCGDWHPRGDLQPKQEQLPIPAQVEHEEQAFPRPREPMYSQIVEPVQIIHVDGMTYVLTYPKIPADHPRAAMAECYSV